MDQAVGVLLEEVVDKSIVTLPIRSMPARHTTSMLAQEAPATAARRPSTMLPLWVATKEVGVAVPVEHPAMETVVEVASAILLVEEVEELEVLGFRPPMPTREGLAALALTVRSRRRTMVEEEAVACIMVAVAVRAVRVVVGPVVLSLVMARVARTDSVVAVAVQDTPRPLLAVTD